MAESLHLLALDELRLDRDQLATELRRVSGLALRRTGSAPRSAGLARLESGLWAKPPAALRRPEFGAAFHHFKVGVDGITV